MLANKQTNKQTKRKHNPSGGGNAAAVHNANESKRNIAVPPIACIIILFNCHAHFNSVWEKIYHAFRVGSDRLLQRDIVSARPAVPRVMIAEKQDLVLYFLLYIIYIYITDHYNHSSAYQRSTCRERERERDRISEIIVLYLSLGGATEAAPANNRLSINQFICIRPHGSISQ